MVGGVMLKQVLFVSLLIFSGLVLLIYLFQRHYIYFPLKQAPLRALFLAEKYKVITFNTTDGLTLHAWYKPAARSKPTLLYFHGNAGHIGYRVSSVKPYVDAGYGVLLLEYRGYGGNPGAPSEQGLYRDGRAAYDYLLKEGVQPDSLVLFGSSLGTGVATQLGTERQACVIILQSPFTSMSDLSRYHYPWILLKPWDRFESINKIDATNAPLLILHGKRDTVVPFEQGLSLFKQASQPKFMISYDDGDHGSLWSEPNFYISIRHFIEGNCQ